MYLGWDKGMEGKWRTTRREDLAGACGPRHCGSAWLRLPTAREEVLDGTSFIRGRAPANQVISTSRNSWVPPVGRCNWREWSFRAFAGCFGGGGHTRQAKVNGLTSGSLQLHLDYTRSLCVCKLFTYNSTHKYNLDFVNTYLSDSTLPRNTNCLYWKMDHKVTKESNCQEFQTPWYPFFFK